MKTAERVLHDLDWEDPQYECDVIKAMKEYALQVAEKVRSDCARKAVTGRASSSNINKAILALDLTQYIK